MDLAVFINNRTPEASESHQNPNAPPMLTFEQSRWYNERWEVMGNKGAIYGTCGWCGQSTPVYPMKLEEALESGTNCHECGRTVDDFYRGWVYRAEYLDGCHATIFRHGRTLSFGVSSGGPTHAPHSAFSDPDELPIYEFLTPQLSLLDKEFSQEELLQFFRKAVHESGIEWLAHPVFKMLAELPETAVTLGGAKG